MVTLGIGTIVNSSLCHRDNSYNYRHFAHQDNSYTWKGVGGGGYETDPVNRRQSCSPS